MKKIKFAEVNLGTRIYLCRNESGAKKGTTVEILGVGEHACPMIIGYGTVIGAIYYPPNEGGYYWI